MSKQKKEKNVKANVGLGIRTKLMMVFTIIIIISLTALGGISYRSMSFILKENLKETSQSVNKEIVAEIDAYLGKYELVVNYLAQDANVKGVTNPENVPWMMKLFEGMKSQDPDILNLYIGTADKKMYIMPVQKMPDGYDPTSRPWYQDAAKSDQMIWTDPYVDANSGALVLSAAKAVKDDSGKVVGVVAIDMSLDAFSKKIDEIKVG